ncbi:MAG: DUF389 domain-containing protein [Pyrinomonadaceae bacterium]
MQDKRTPVAETSRIAVFARWLGMLIPKVFARAVGVDDERKSALFIDLSRAATLRDIVYWLQIFFSAGIATLGLVLNSPAVIIGAMLISPLMNPILASGLALATGDIVLGLRAFFNLFLSCLAAIGFAVFLVVILPFREMTTEIAVRMRPNVLDLIIAMFSGAVGSVAICRDVKGVVTSIPGVAIAVALMPPLCVVGYGVGLMLAFHTATGWRIASGGGLLFLTNLVAITLMATIVFLALRIDTPKVRERVLEWEREDAESAWIIGTLERFPFLDKARRIHSLALRLSMILVPLIVILIPLSISFSQLKDEIVQKRRESSYRKIITDVWQENYGKKFDGVLRSSVDQLTVAEKDGNLTVNLRVFDDQPYSLAEKKECAQLIARRLQRPVESIVLNLTEIPTVSVLEALNRVREEPPLPAASTPVSVREKSLERIEIALADFVLPPPARMVQKQIVTSLAKPLEVKITYLSDERISPETETDILGRIRQGLNDGSATVNIERVGVEIGEISFNPNQSSLPLLGMIQLDFSGRMIRDNPKLRLAVVIGQRRNEEADIATKRARSIIDYIGSRWQVQPANIQITRADTPTGIASLSFTSEEDFH